MAYNPLVIGGGVEATAQRVTIASDSTGVVSVDDNGGSLTVDASSLPLPTGASTSANQATIIGHVDGIEGLLTTIDADTGGIATSTASIDTKTPALGQALASGSVPVVLTAAQVSTLTPPAAITGFATEATLGSVKTAVETIDNAVSGAGFNITQLGGANVPIGAGLEATAVRVTLPTDGTGKVSVVQGTATNLKTQAEAYQGGSAVAAGNPLQVTLANGTVPSHAVTNAGTFATQVDGAALTSLQLIDDVVHTGDAALSKYAVMGAVLDDVGTGAVTENQANALRMSSRRALLVEGVASGTAQPVSAASGTIASGAIASGAIASGAIASGAVAAGAFAIGSISAGAIAAGAASIAITEDTASASGEHLVKMGAVRLDTPVANANVSNDGDWTNPLVNNFGKLWITGSVLEDTAHVAGEAILQSGARRIDTAATSAGTSGDWATIDSSAEGALWTTLTPTTTSGLSIFRTLDLDESEEEVKATAGNIYGYMFSNTVASIRYLKFYNATAANTTVGTTTPIITFALPASQSGHISFPVPITFGTALSVAVTTGIADSDTGAPGTNDVILNVFYK